MAALLALASAATFSLADFLGGVASRRAHELMIAMLSQVAGLLVLAVVLPLGSAVPSTPALAWGLVAGIGGAGGLVAYFRALAIGPMGITAPLAAVVGAAVPITVGLSLGERPSGLAMVGVALGVAAAALVSRQAADASEEAGAHLADRDAAHDPARLRHGLAAAAIAGLLFGLFFVALDQAPDEGGLWPLLGARAAGIGLLAALLARRRPSAPDGATLRVGLLSGLLDMVANVFFLLATQQGMLVIVSVLASLYPVGVVLLARVVLREWLGRAQWVGVGLAIVATVLIGI